MISQWGDGNYKTSGRTFKRETVARLCQEEVLKFLNKPERGKGKVGITVVIVD